MLCLKRKALDDFPWPQKRPVSDRNGQRGLVLKATSCMVTVEAFCVSGADVAKSLHADTESGNYRATICRSDVYDAGLFDAKDGKKCPIGDIEDGSHRIVWANGASL